MWWEEGKWYVELVYENNEYSNIIDDLSYS